MLVHDKQPDQNPSVQGNQDAEHPSERIDLAGDFELDGFDRDSSRAPIFAVEEAMFFWDENTADFADCIIGAHNRRLGCRVTATFASAPAKPPAFVAL